MDTKPNYRQMLEDGFAALRKMNPDGTPENRAAFLADYVFDFTTYDDEKSKEFGTKALEVCRAVSDRKTFEYIEDPENYRWFLLMVNMPFFAVRLDWGTSVRGAWWNAGSPDETALHTAALWLDGEQLTGPLQFSDEQWQEFVSAMLAFADVAPGSGSAASA
jgi:hypothetical protein